MRHFSLLLVLAGCLSAADIKAPIIVLNGLTPQKQIPGDVSQIYETAYFTEPTQALQLTSAGLWGFDEGVSTELADGRFLWLTGDAVAAYYNSGQSKWMGITKRTDCSDGAGGTVLCLGVKAALLVTPAGTEWNCSHLGDVSTAMIGGNLTPSIGYTNCTSITPLTDAAHTSTQPKMLYLQESASGLSGGETMGPGNTPQGMFTVGNALYVVMGTVQQTRSRLSYHPTASIMKVSDTTGITTTAFPTLTKVIKFSQAPTIPAGNASVTLGSAVVTRTSGTSFDTAWTDATQWSKFEVDGTEYTISSVDTASQITLTAVVTAGAVCTTGTCTVTWSQPPNIDTRTGKMMFCGADNFTHAQTLSYGWNSFLPSALQSATNVVMAECSGFYYRHSNVYMLAIDASLIDSSTNSGSGISNAWYMVGLDSQNQPTWTQGDEANAAPLLTTWGNGTGLPCVGEMSTRYIPVLRRMVMAYGAATCGGIRMRTASYPWGPWSADTRVMPNVADSGWEGRLIYAPADPRNPNFNQATVTGVQLYDANQACCVVLNNSAGGSPFSLSGNPYGAYLWPASAAHDNGDGSATALLNISGFNPYVVWQSKVTIQIPRNTRVAGVHAKGVHFK